MRAELFCLIIGKFGEMFFFKVLSCVTLVLRYTSAGPGDVAKAKCQEYGKAVFSTEDSPVLLKSPSQNKVSQCGIVEVPLIIGGVNAGPKEFPHMAVIGFGQSPSDNLAWHCGGSLISEKFVLTAAHCLDSRDKGPAQKVRFGELDLSTTSDATQTQERGIARKIAHPNYKPPSKYDDIALIELNAPVNFDGYVRPACLHVEENIPGARGIAAGFGRLSYDAEEGSNQLMKVTITFIESAQCEGAYKAESSTNAMPQGLQRSMLCAGEMNGGKDTCQGDSGGPLQIVLTSPECMYSLVGVTSFGKFCGFKNSPAIYSKVSHYVPWIEGIVW